MAWAYNQIDVKVSPRDNQLGEVNPNNDNWWTISDFGIMRGRPTITPSTVDSGNNSAIPGRNGNPYPVNKRRGNATLEFEVLVADAWPFQGSSLKLYERIARLKAIGISAKRISYKEPGRDLIWDETLGQWIPGYKSFFIVYNTTVTEQDADEKCSVLKFKMEVYPFKFDFEGNREILLSTPDASNDLSAACMLSSCYPIYKFKLPIYDQDPPHHITVRTVDEAGQRVYTNKVEIAPYTGDQNHTTYIDTEKQLVYGISETEGYIDRIRSRSQYIKGDISGLYFKCGAKVYVSHDCTDTGQGLNVYTRSGVEI